ncbi:Hypothetical predicted protein [Paramuricea clavata]|uniref:Uncharacterized protein n=1 Tax=Paramuricea clavata TaxID=317549 RepID=A0A6S7K750_PARCT|nr:Hypothetical predicted protein [Paramuricea clavata]
MSMRDRYLKHIKPKRLQRSKRRDNEPTNNNDLQHRMKCKIFDNDSEDDRSVCTSTTDGDLNENIPKSPSLEKGCTRSEGQIPDACKEIRPTETGNDDDVCSTSESKSDLSYAALSPFDRRLLVVVKKGLEQRSRLQELREQEELRQKKEIRGKAGMKEKAEMLTEQTECSNVVTDQLNVSDQELAVLKMVSLIRTKTKASLPQIFFGLFRTNANVEDTVTFLDNKETKNVWTAQEDQMLQGNDMEEVENIINKRGHLAVKRRLNFIERRATV